MSHDDLSPEAQALLRKARGADRATSAEVRSSIERFGNSRVSHSASHATVAGGSGRWSRRPTPWAVIVAVLSGTLGAYATVGHSIGLPMPGWWPTPSWSPTGSNGTAERWSVARQPAIEEAAHRRSDPAQNANPAQPEAPPVALSSLTSEQARTSAQVGPGTTPPLQPNASSASSRDAATSAKPRQAKAKLETASTRGAALAPTPTDQPTSTDPVLANTTPGNVAQARQLSREVATITAARDAVRSNDCAAAQQHLDRHHADFPQGALSQERRALAAICACRTGAGKAAARRYVDDSAGSPLARRVASECDLTLQP